MTLTDLQWEIHKILTVTSLKREEREAVQDRLNQVIEKFGKDLITQLGIIFNAKD
jgi:DNA-binding protein H-NS